MTDHPKDPDQIPEGRLEERLSRVEPTGVPLPPVEEKLELDLRGREIQARVDSYRADLRARSARPWALKLVVFALLLGVGGLIAFLSFKPKLQSLPPLDGVHPLSLLDELSAGEEAQPIIISSTPTGASIYIGGKAIGQTPWAGENRWKGETSLVLKYPGYRPWEGKLKGGQPQTFDLTLKK